MRLCLGQAPAKPEGDLVELGLEFGQGQTPVADLVLFGPGKLAKGLFKRRIIKEGVLSKPIFSGRSVRNLTLTSGLIS